jgi:glycogen synthase
VKIALLSYEYPPETGFGGIGTYTWFHARALARLGHEVHVIAGATSAASLRRADHDGVQLWRHRGGGVQDRLLAPLGRLKWWWSRERARIALDMRSAFRTLDRQIGFDVVEMPECGAEGLFVHRAAHGPTVVRFHSPAQLIMPFYDVERGDTRLCSALEAFAIRGATGLTSSSRFLAQAVQQQLQVRAPIEVLHNGIDVDWFDRTEQIDARTHFGIPTDRPMVLFLGRMERRKGIQLCREIVPALLERHDASFVFAGDDLFGHVANELLPAVRQRASSGTQKGAVYALGRLDAVRVRSLLRQTDIVFLPSLWESCPYSCLEAMAARRAVVASDAGGFPELLRHGENGMIVPSGDANGFVEALADLLDDPARRDRLGAAARADVERNYRDTDIAARAVGIYGRLRH